MAIQIIELVIGTSLVFLVCKFIGMAYRGDYKFDDEDNIK